MVKLNSLTKATDLWKFLDRVKLPRNYNNKISKETDKIITEEFSDDDIRQGLKENGFFLKNKTQHRRCEDIMSQIAFSTIKISMSTMKAIKEMGFTQMTEVQASAIPHLLRGTNIMASAQTGSGKTLAF